MSWKTQCWWISMLQTQRMTKIKIVGSREQLSLVVDVLHQLRLVHLLDHAKTPELDIGSPIGESERIAALLIKIRSLLSTFPASLSEKKPFSGSLETLEHSITTILEKYTGLQNSLARLQEMIAQKQGALTQLQLLAALGFSADVLQPYKHLALFIGSVQHIEGLYQSISPITTTNHFTSCLHESKWYVGVLVSRQHEAAVEKALQQHGFHASTFSDLSSYHGSVLHHIQKIEISLDILHKDSTHLLQEREKFMTEHARFLRSAESFLQKEAEKSLAPVRFAETKYAFLIQGWVSSKEYQRLKHALETETEKKVHLEVLPLLPQDKIPIILKNLFVVKPFEFFMHLYTLPSYREMDPSFFLFFTFPFFFGMMLGDVGYGLVTFLLFACLWWKLPKGRNLLAAMMLCSLVTIAFGFVFGEYFGVEAVSESTGEYLLQWGIPLLPEEIHGETVYSFPRLLNRLHSYVTVLGNTLPTILVLGALLGFLHVNLGLFLGFINEVVSHGFKHAFFAKISWYILEFGVALAAFAGLGMVSLHWGVGLGVILLAAVFLFIGEGVQGIVELPALFTNILSYLRLGAVALASVGLAVVVNEELAMPFLEKGGIFIVVGFVILCLGHAINIALGVIGPFLHALRLHYVEFFSKFYKGGSIPFIAFGEEKE